MTRRSTARRSNARNQDRGDGWAWETAQRRYKNAEHGTRKKHWKELVAVTTAQLVADIAARKKAEKLADRQAA
jgi:hypothetical protein